MNRGIAAVQAMNSLVGLMPDHEVRNTLERGEYFHLFSSLCVWANKMAAILPAGPPVPQLEEIDLADGGQDQEEKDLARLDGGN